MKRITIAVIVLIIAATTAFALGGGEPKAADNYKNGIAALNAGNFDKAIDDFTKAFEERKDVVNSFLGRAYAYAKKGDFEEANAYIGGALSWFPPIEDAFEKKIWVDFADDFMKVVEDFEKQLTINISDIKEDLGMQLHFAMADISRGLMMMAED